jgi:hypothetical protein
MRSIRLAVLAAAVLVAFPVSAALQIKETLKPGGGGPPTERKVIVSGTKLRIDDGNVSLIFDSASRRVVRLHHGAKTWTEGKVAQIGETAEDPTGGKYGAAFGKSVDLTGDKRSVEVRPSDETRTIAGVEAKRVDIYRDGILARKSWHASSVDANELMDIQNSLAISDLAPMVATEVAIWTRTATIGFAVRVEDVVTGASMEVTEIRRDKPADSLFAPPAGYRKLD